MAFEVHYFIFSSVTRMLEHLCVTKVIPVKKIKISEI